MYKTYDFVQPQIMGWTTRNNFVNLILNKWPTVTKQSTKCDGNDIVPAEEALVFDNVLISHEGNFISDNAKLLKPFGIDEKFVKDKKKEFKKGNIKDVYAKFSKRDLSKTNTFIEDLDLIAEYLNNFISNWDPYNTYLHRKITFEQSARLMNKCDNWSHHSPIQNRIELSELFYYNDNDIVDYIKYIDVLLYTPIDANYNVQVIYPDTEVDKEVVGLATLLSILDTDKEVFFGDVNLLQTVINNAKEYGLIGDIQSAYYCGKDTYQRIYTELEIAKFIWTFTEPNLDANSKIVRRLANLLQNPNKLIIDPAISDNDNPGLVFKDVLDKTKAEITALGESKLENYIFKYELATNIAGVCANDNNKNGRTYLRFDVMQSIALSDKKLFTKIITNSFSIDYTRHKETLLQKIANFIVTGLAVALAAVTNGASLMVAKLIFSVEQIAFQKLGMYKEAFYSDQFVEIIDIYSNIIAGINLVNQVNDVSIDALVDALKNEFKSLKFSIKSLPDYIHYASIGYNYYETNKLKHTIQKVEKKQQQLNDLVERTNIHNSVKSFDIIEKRRYNNYYAEQLDQLDSSFYTMTGGSIDNMTNKYY